jgi:ankyrin repeat protein/Flp pilus assembly protein TadD
MNSKINHLGQRPLKRIIIIVAGLMVLSSCSTPKHSRAVRPTVSPAQSAPAPAGNTAANPPPVPVDHVRLAMEQLAKGVQKNAEDILARACASAYAPAPVVFLNAACLRSRFEISAAALGWVKILRLAPNTPMGQAAACILGQDMAKNTPTALYYFSGLIIVARENPKDPIIQWMAAVMARALTRDDTKTLSNATRQSIIAYGIEEYRNVLVQFAPGRGPTLVHQTLANLLSAMGDDSNALDHYRIVLERERRPWALNAAAGALDRLCRWDEALALADESLAQDPKSDSALRIRGDALWALDRSEEALNAWLQASPSGRHDWLLSTGRQALTAGYPDQARLFLQQAEKLDPNDKVALVLLARIAVMEDMPGACEALWKLGNLDWQGKFVAAPPAPDPDNTPWFQAVETGDIAAVRRLLPKTPVDTTTKTYHATALMTAAQVGWTDIVQTLIAAGAKLDLTDINGDTALNYASQFKQPACVRLLLASRANPNLLDKWGQSPLVMAVQDYQWKTARLLINHPGIDLNLCSKHRGTALHFAAGYGQSDIVRLLIKHDADINLVSPSDGRTPTMATCLDYPHPDSLAVLLDAGAAINAQDRQGRTALRLAIQPTPTPQLTDALLRHGADPRIADKKGVTPIAAAHLLGYAELAARMEAAAGGPPQALPWTLPMLARPADATTTEALANAFTLPIALIHGVPIEFASKASAGKPKNPAIAALATQFGIANAEDFKTVFYSLDRLLPLNHTDKLVTLLDEKYPQFAAQLDNKVGRIFYAGMPAETGPLAWRKSRLIYLTRLGEAAGYIPKPDAVQIWADAIQELKAAFTSWAQFEASFVFGAVQNEGWERQRYEHICQVLLACPPELSPWQAAVW